MNSTTAAPPTFSVCVSSTRSNACSANAGWARARTPSGRTARREPGFGLHAAQYSRAVPGESYTYPQFQGFFGEWRWLEIQTADGNVRIGNGGGAVPYFALYAPAGGEKPVIELPRLDWSFLHAIAPIGTKFTPPDVLGPQSQLTTFDRPVGGTLTLELSPR